MKRILIATLSVLIAAGTAGCLERKETIRVHRDGGVAMHVEISGDPADFSDSDALPERDSPWRAADRMEKDPENEKEKQIRVADREFAAGQELPDAYLEPRDEWHDVVLQFPTTVAIDKREDGVYYHFKRIYKARQEARYNAIREQNPELFEEVKSFSGKAPEELSDDQRIKIVTALLVTEAAKQSEFMQAGIDAMKEKWPQHYGLLVRQELMDHYNRIKPAEVAGLLAQPQSAERDARINRLGERTLAEGRESIHELLRKLDVPSREIDQFFDAANIEEQRRLVTEDIGDECWTVEVHMPGRIVASNATSADQSAAVWEFNGKCMNDRDHVLMVTSKVERGEDK